MGSILTWCWQLTSFAATRDAELFQHGLDPSVAGKCLLLVRVVEGECLFEGEQVLSAVVTGERFLDHLDTGVATPIPHARQHCRIALASKDRSDDPQPGHTSNIGDDVMELHVHFSQRLLHVLDMRCPILQQTLTLTQVSMEQDRPVGASIVAYYRVSTPRQGKSGLGLEAQRKAVAAYAASQGLTVADEFTE